MDDVLRQDPFSQIILDLGRRNGGADVEDEVADFVTERKQAFHRGELSSAGRIGKSAVFEFIRPVLQILKIDMLQRPIGEINKLIHVSEISFLRTRTLSVEPELHEVAIIFGVRRTGWMVGVAPL